ncbi:hypothetical protein [Kitasatospora sp. NPDC057738]|uniref:hypothetical protein n=1 Tax=Kitasatospora sp. NPDC057738 TaxID=3346233 RepID=UPI0036BB3D5E
MTSPAWTDDEIVAGLHEFAEARGLPLPAPTKAADEFEALTGFPMAPLLRRIYCEVADGGFGPYGGVVSLTESKRRFSHEGSLARVYRKWATEPGFPPGVVPLVTLGGVIWWCLDLSTPEGAMWGMDENACDHHYASPQDVTLAEWLTDWLLGNDTFPTIPPVPDCSAC